MKTRFFWAVRPRDGGQLVTRHYPQIAGAADESTSDMAGHVEMTTFGSEWELFFDGVRVLSGRGEPIDCGEATELYTATRRHMDERRESCWGIVRPDGRLGEIVRVMDAVV